MKDRVATPPALTALSSLARVRAKLDATDPDLAWLVAAADRVLAGVTPSLDEALGLRMDAPAARRRRDAAIFELAQRYYAKLPINAQVTALAVTLGRYRLRCWPDDRLNGRVPPPFAATERAALFLTFMLANGDVPESKKQLRRIVRAGHARHGMSRAA